MDDSREVFRKSKQSGGPRGQQKEKKEKTHHVLELPFDFS